MKNLVRACVVLGLLSSLPVAEAGLVETITNGGIVKDTTTGRYKFTRPDVKISYKAIEKWKSSTLTEKVTNLAAAPGGGVSVLNIEIGPNKRVRMLSYTKQLFLDRNFSTVVGRVKVVYSGARPANGILVPVGQILSNFRGVTRIVRLHYPNNVALGKVLKGKIPLIEAKLNAKKNGITVSVKKDATGYVLEINLGTRKVRYRDIAVALRRALPNRANGMELEFIAG